MNVPSIEEATRILEEAENMNPGPWSNHCRTAATAAEKIAEHVEGMDQKTAYVMGLLHDIGRRFGVSGMKHVTDGYNFMNELGYTDVARICYTHSFPYKNMGEYYGVNDVPSDDYEKLKNHIENCEYDDYDRLIQLCDAVALPESCCLIEKRLVDVVMRHGVTPLTAEKFKAYFGLKTYFEQKMSKDLYNVLPNVVEGTFGKNFR